METNSNKTIAALMNLSTLTQYFFPFGNFIFPIVIWNSNKEKSEYINKQGKEIINFQLSLFVYNLILALIAIPILLVTFFKSIDFNQIENNNEIVLDYIKSGNMNGFIIIAFISILVFIFIKIAEFFLIIYATIKTSNGEDYKYPLTIPFIK